MNKFNDFLKDILGVTKKYESEFSLEDFDKSYLDELRTKLSKVEFQKIDFKSVEIIETKANNGGLKIKAIASTAAVDRGQDIVMPQGIDTSHVKNGMLPMLFNHDYDTIIGAWTKWKAEGNTFLMEGFISPPVTDIQKDVYQKVQEGILNGISIGFIGHEVKMEGDIRVFHKIELLEVSVVTIPMHQDAHITDVKINESKSLESEAVSESTVSEESPAKEATEVEPQVPSTESANTEGKESTPDSNQEQELAKLKEENDALKNENASLKQTLDEIESEMEEAAQVINELAKMKGAKNV